MQMEGFKMIYDLMWQEVAVIMMTQQETGYRQNKIKRKELENIRKFKK